MKSRAWTVVVVVLGILALLVFGLSILDVAPIPVRGTVIRTRGWYSSVILPGCIFALCIAEFIRSRRSSPPLWSRITFVAVVLVGLVCSVFIVSHTLTVRESDTTPLSKEQLRQAGALIDAYLASPTPSPR
jgi:hypothetical protein